MLQQLAIFVFILSSLVVKAQSGAIGDWRVHQPFRAITDIVNAGDKIYGSSEYNLFSVDVEEQFISRYTKATGLSSSDITGIDFDKVNGILVITYQSGNIDIIKNNRIINIPDIKDKVLFTDKTIYNVSANNGVAWLSTGFGVVKVDLLNNEIDETYLIGDGNSNLKVNDVYVNDTAIFAATDKGVRWGVFEGNNLSSINNWQHFNDNMSFIDPNTPYTHIASFGNKIYISSKETLHSFIGINWEFSFTQSGWEIVDANGVGTELLLVLQRFENNVFEEFSIVALNNNGILIRTVNNSSNISQPFGIEYDDFGNIWVADFVNGLVKLDANFNFITSYKPNAPTTASINEMTFFNEHVYAAGSSIDFDWNINHEEAAVFKVKDYNWSVLDASTIPALEGLTDIAVLEPIPNGNKLLLGSHGNALLELDVISNTITNRIEANTNFSGNLRVTGMSTDVNGNIWISNAYSNVPIICRKPDGSYFNLSSHRNSIINSLKGSLVNGVLADNFGQIWFSTSTNGVVVLNTNNTLEDFSDDAVKRVTSFNSNAILCMTNDQDGEIWIGTRDGVEVIFCPLSVINNACNPEQVCIPRNEGSNFCDNLLEGELVTSIHVDPGNRKWIGTNNGIFLQSEDGLETIHSFTEENSPLLSNQIKSVATDENTGDVFIGTSKGIISFKGEATTTTENSGEPFVYPNPIRPGYSGPIAIRNLPNNGNVKILDAAGYLVWEGASLGGQAIWYGVNGNGERVKSGVYYVLAANEDGTEKAKTKLVLVN